MARSKEEKIIILKNTIIELQRRYDLINQMYESAKFNTLTFLGAGFALLAYLYANPNNTGNEILDLLFFPREIYGKLFYLISLYLIFTSMASLFKCIRGARWEFPCEAVILKNIESKENDLSTLEYIRNEYIQATSANLKTYDDRMLVLNDSLLKLTVGGIMIVLIKFFGNP